MAASPGALPSRRPVRKSLPIAAGSRKIRPSGMGRWRALVLVLVHVMIAIHIAHWWKTGRTISPLEPSEAMEFAKHGVINAGFIFFSLAIFSTLVLGRWFCGWACHLVALQDLCRWLLEKIRIRPRPIRSTVLMTVPLVAFIYMFVAPALYPTALSMAGANVAGHSWSFDSVRLNTDNFWATFPTWVPATLTLLVCGFVIIYVLGAKGFCSVACPYGAAFGFVDRYAPMRVRVTEDCTQSGHCTAVCTSNVRVHEEVRDFKMVVDPGCMKCLDCVKVCPNDALFVGFGMPAALASPVATAKPPAPTNAARPFILLALQVPFIFVAYLAFHGFDIPRRFDLNAGDFVYAAILTMMTFVVLLIARGKSRRPREHTLSEECMFAAFFLVGMYCFRGLHDLIPFLFALGLSAIFAFVTTHACLLAARRQVGILGFRLKRDGQLQSAAAGFLAVVGLFVSLLVYGGFHQTGQVTQRWRDYAALDRFESAFAQPEQMFAQAREAIPVYENVVRYEPQAIARIRRLVALHTMAGSSDPRHYDRGLAIAERGLLVRPDDAVLHHATGTLLAAKRDITRALPWFEAAYRIDPSYAPAAQALGDSYAVLERWPDAVAAYRAAINLTPNETGLRASFVIALLQTGAIDDARREMTEALRIAPNDANLRALQGEMEQMLRQPRKP